MKLVEKLSKTRTQIIAAELDWSGCCPISIQKQVETALQDAYSFGFRKAREMADKRIESLLEFLAPKDEDGDYVRPIQHAQFDIRRMGEEEV